MDMFLANQGRKPHHCACSIPFSLDRSLLFYSVCPESPTFPPWRFNNGVFIISPNRLCLLSLTHTVNPHLLPETSGRDAPPSFLKLFQGKCQKSN
ncbi:hypothetical protein L1887_30741 [Cichorium endivia]|nr:hypothetical protein L1887_30741 [Cichorium endivia]